MTDDVLRVAALLVPCLLGLWTAVACRRAHYHGLPGADALVWAGLIVISWSRPFRIARDDAHER
jgi:hypothetical protein